MNSQPKFKKGDRVRVIGGTRKGEIIRYSLEHLAYEVMCEDFLSRFWYESDLEPLPSPAPDMLAIPDDHVFQVEWRKIDGEAYNEGIIFTDQNHVNHSMRSWHTHYLTSQDLLKIPFKK